MTYTDDELREYQRLYPTAYTTGMASELLAARARIAELEAKLAEFEPRPLREGDGWAYNDTPDDTPDDTMTEDQPTHWIEGRWKREEPLRAALRTIAINSVDIGSRQCALDALLGEGGER